MARHGSVMAAEIHEQPEAVARTVDALRPERAALRRLADGARLVTFIARGSSDNAAVYGRYLVEVHAGRAAALAAPSVATDYHAPVDLRGTLAVALSQSGETGEIVATLEWARACGARTVAVTNQAGSRLAGAADLALVTRAGTERAVPATKTYTTQLAALAVLGDALGPDPGALDGALARVPVEIGAALGLAGQAAALAARLAGADGLVVSGRGFAYSTALELALKLKETCYLPTLGLSYADLLHGPIAVVDPGVPALLVAAGDGPMLPAMTTLAREVTARGGAAYGIGGDAGFAAACAAALPGTRLPERVAPLALVVPGQLLVEALARRLGFDPDQPRGLRKVTQTPGGGEGRARTGPSPPGRAVT